jgi:hypothetical protein
MSVLEKLLISKIIVLQLVFSISYNPQYSACKSNAVSFFNDPGQNIQRIKLPMHANELSNYVYFIIPSKRTRDQLRQLLNFKSESNITIIFKVSSSSNINIMTKHFTQKWFGFMNLWTKNYLFLVGNKSF